MRNGPQYKIQGCAWELETQHSGKAPRRRTLSSTATPAFLSKSPGRVTETYALPLSGFYCLFVSSEHVLSLMRRQIRGKEVNDTEVFLVF